MSDTEVKAYLVQMAALQQQVIDTLSDLPREEFKYETDSARWNTVRRVLLRFGDHIREHTTQLVAAREDIGAAPTMTARILAQAQQAYGYFLGAMVGLQDADLDKAPEPGEWTPRQVLEHLIAGQQGYLHNIEYARTHKKAVERD